MATREQASAAPGEREAMSLAEPSAPRPGAPGANISDGFRDARSALGQIATDFQRLRRHAASLVKGTHRTAR
jgi:hypothetical protein